MSNPLSKQMDTTPITLGKVTPDELIKQQIFYINRSVDDAKEFRNNIEILRRMVPKHVKTEIEERKNEYLSIQTQYTFVKVGGIVLGTVEDPIYRNKKEDWNYKGGEPILVSPTQRQIEVVDYFKLYDIILEQLEVAGITWREIQEDIEGGDIDDGTDEDISNLGKKTPLITESYK